MKKTITNLPPYKNLDELIKYLEKLHADLHVPVQQRASGGGLPLDERNTESPVHDAGVSGEVGADHLPAHELYPDERQVLLRADDEGRTDEGVHDGQEEEASPVTTLEDVMIELFRQRVALEELVEQNAWIGGRIVALIAERDANNE